jgi:7-cyano-7-deazaguanine synthase in queuosine biosynthesis
MMWIEDAVKTPCVLAASGGLDSAYCLYHATTDAVLLHADFGLAMEAPQRVALARQMTYLGKDFELIEKAITPQDLDYYEAVKEMLVIAGDRDLKTIVIGDSLHCQMTSQEADKLGPLADTTFRGVTLSRMCGVGGFAEVKAAYLGMPKEYLAMTWSCRTPKETEEAWHKCGWCGACKLHQIAGLWSQLPQSMMKEI